jgi:transcriptional regulator with XRE-family HTH domain
MRASSKKTTSAVLRSIIGIKDVEMAEILDCSPGTIHSLESGRLKLSDSLAMRMSHETGVAMDWLLDGNPKVLPYARDGTPFTRDIFDRARSKLITPINRVLIQFAGREFSEAVVSILRAAYTKGNAELAVYKVGRAINELAREFGGEGAEAWFKTETFRRSFFTYQGLLRRKKEFSPQRRRKA